MDQKLEAQAGERFAESASLATEAVTSIRTVASLTMESEILKEYSNSMDVIVRTATRGFFITMLPYALSQSVDFLVLALGFWYGELIFDFKQRVREILMKFSRIETVGKL